jgi:hypothetical protein
LIDKRKKKIGKTACIAAKASIHILEANQVSTIFVIKNKENTAKSGKYTFKKFL